MTAPENVYHPYGNARKLFQLRRLEADEIILDGPIRTGKTRAVLELANLLAETYPESRHLLIRKTRVSMTQSVLVTWEEAVKPHCDVGRMGRAVRDEYRYANGSRVVVGGMDSDDKVLSAEYDMIYTFETRELNASDHEILTGRLTHGKMPYQKLVGDTNPDRPKHYLKIREERYGLLMLSMTLRDNPRWYDSSRAAYTPEGQALLKKLDRITGVRHLRLVRGLWTSAEGMIYDDFNPDFHVLHYDSKQFPYPTIPRAWRRVCVVDFGFTEPFVAQWWAIDPDGRMYLYREWYKTRVLVEDHAKKMRELERGERIEATVCDHDAEGRATLEKHLKRKTLPARKRILEGIQEVQSRLKVQPDGKARLYVMQGALVEPDPELTEPEEGSPLPSSSLEEVDGYIWAEGKTKEQPVDVDNHGMDCWRYAAMYLARRNPRKPGDDTHSYGTM